MFDFPFPMPSLCPDCAIRNSPPHWEQWLESFFADVHNWALEPFLDIGAQYSPAARRWAQRAGMVFIHALGALGILKFVEDQSDHPVMRTRVLAESAKRLDITLHNIRFLGMPGNLFLARHNGKELLFEGLPRPLKSPTALRWMDDKFRARKHLANAGLPVPRGGSARTLKETREHFQKLSKPLIVKPRSNSGARHTSMRVNTEEDLQNAVEKAKQVSHSVIIEEEIPGAVHRALMVDGRLVAFARRDYPSVTGDGIHTIKELHAQENANPRRDKTNYYPIPTLHDPEAQQWLAAQRVSVHSVPATGQTIRLGSKHLRTRGAAIHELTPIVHPEIRDLCERTAAAVNDPLIGIDIILSDATKSWKEQPCAIIELNSTPFIDVHIDPLYGKPVMVADEIWKMTLP